MNKKKQRGQTIIEATIALASIMLTLAAISIAVTTSVNNSQFIKNQGLASKYAQDGMEKIRHMSKNDPQAFYAKQNNLTYCLDSNSVFSSGGAGGCSVNVGGAYKREAEFSHNDISCGDASKSSSTWGTRVTVTVFWASGKCSVQATYCHKSQLISCFARQDVSGTSL